MAVSGFFKVQFSALAPGAGGVISVEDGKVRGGDNQYLYSGTFAVTDAGATATLRVKAHTPNAKDVFGGTGASFNLSLTGQIDDTKFSFSGPSPKPGSPPITIQGTKVAQLDLL